MAEKLGQEFHELVAMVEKPKVIEHFTEEHAWVIERIKEPRFWGRLDDAPDAHQLGWVEDHMRAIRYCREIDATVTMNSLGLTLGYAHVIPHVWSVPK